MRRTVRRCAALAAVAVLLLACSPDLDDLRAGPEPTFTPTATGTPTAPTSPGPTPSAGTATPTTSAAALPAYYRQRLSWRGCGGGAQCATLQVPLDYAAPKPQLIDVEVLRLPATGRRMGSVLVNPGGPGGSGVDYARRDPVTKRLRGRFDVVGFDPRGVGRSTPVRCVSTSFLDDYIAADATPDTAAERNRLNQLSRTFAQGCGQRARRLLAHVSTADAARDIDVLRAALGDEKLTYMGKSYGTLLGATYAEIFPARVRALVLDGAVDPALTTQQLNRAQAKGFETALRSFIADCVRRSSCPLGDTPAEGERAIRELFTAAERKPLPAGDYANADGRQTTEAIAELGVATALYSRQSWQFLRSALAAAINDGDGSDLLYLSDLLVDRGDRSYSNQTESNLAVNCVDRPSPRDPAAYDRDAAAFSRESPHFGSFIAYGSLPCAYWPVPPVGTAARLDAAGSPPILVIGTTRDPATPYEWAVSLADQLAAGVLLTYRGDGHTVYAEGNGCVDRVADDYLIDLKAPRQGVTC